MDLPSLKYCGQVVTSPCTFTSVNHLNMQTKVKQNIVLQRNHKQHLKFFLQVNNILKYFWL